MVKLTDNPNALASIVTELGGVVLPGDTFRFDLPVAKVHEVVPELNRLGVYTSKVAGSEREEDDPLRPRNSRSMVTIALHYEPQVPQDTMVRSQHVSLDAFPITPMKKGG